MVGEIRAAGVEDGVVVATPQFDDDLAGDGTRDPALRRLAQHEGLRVEPAPLIQQPAESTAIVPILFDGVLVVDAGDQALVPDVQKSHSRTFVNAAALGLSL